MPGAQVFAQDNTTAEFTYTGSNDSDYKGKSTVVIEGKANSGNTEELQCVTVDMRKLAQFKNAKVLKFAKGVKYVAFKTKPDTGDNSGNTGNIGENKGNTTTGGGTDKEKKSDVESGNKNNTTENKDTTEKAADKTSLTPTTGDNTNIAVWVVLLLLAGSGIVVLILKKKKNGKKFLSLFLCLTMLGTTSMGFSTSAEAAEVENESISISENILVDNNELEIKAIVKYDRDMKSEEEPTDAGEISFRKPSDDHIVSDEATGDYFVDNEILLTAREGTAREEIEKIVSEINGVIVGCIEITNDYQIEISEAILA